LKPSRFSLLNFVQIVVADDGGWCADAPHTAPDPPATIFSFSF
jgi:hypothetical protein